MLRIILVISMILTVIQIATAVQCNTDPCKLTGQFHPPNYQCIQTPDDVNNVICTCPDGNVQVNAPCRICDTTDCGPNSICIELQFFENLYYGCGCSNGTHNFINPGRCPDTIQATTTTTAIPSVTCLNGGIYIAATGTCICQTGFTGLFCETSTSQANCQNVVCANGGVCNPVASTINGVDMQCLCLNGFSGPNCELIGTPGRCTPDLCQNGGVCEEQANGVAVFAYCRCPAGTTGKCCEQTYFSCPAHGLFADPVNCKYGRYFQCNGLTLTSLSCPRGLRYNFMKMQCDSDVSCPP